MFIFGSGGNLETKGRSTAKSQWIGVTTASPNALTYTMNNVPIGVDTGASRLVVFIVHWNGDATSNPIAFTVNGATPTYLTGVSYAANGDAILMYSAVLSGTTANLDFTATTANITRLDVTVFNLFGLNSQTVYSALSTCDSSGGNDAKVNLPKTQGGITIIGAFTTSSVAHRPSLLIAGSSVDTAGVSDGDIGLSGIITWGRVSGSPISFTAALISDTNVTQELFASFGYSSTKYITAAHWS